jgi:penicillin amidase
VKTLKRLLAVIALLLIAGTGGTVLWARSARPLVDGEIAVPGLASSVEILRDSLGVPHVWAADEESLLFAQGWVHAQDRLWQMELFRHVAEGRLAEILGPDLVETDRFLRTVGLWRAAARQEQATPPALMRLLRAYAAGVNAWIEAHDGALPPEFLVLRIRPAPWTPRHSLALEKIMAWDLSFYGLARQLAQAALALGPERARYLAPGYPDWAPDIVAATSPPPMPPLAAQFLDAFSITRASNAWVIGGGRTRSGKPILANDMHLALRAPSIWHLMALHGDGMDIAGMTLPGGPFVVAGHNRAVAWGFTNAMLDDADFFVERVDPADPGRYLAPGGSVPFEVIPERIAVRGADTVDLDIRLTRHGPVLEDVEAGADSSVIALAWAAAEPSSTFTALRDLNRARSAADVVAATRLFDDPHQNVVYADTAGDFGYRMAGRIPVRRNAQPPPLLPVPGWTGDWDWTAFLPPDSHPAVANPAAGFVVTANNRQTAGPIGDRITRSWEPPFRAARIGQMIEQAGPLDADGVHAMQLDVRDAMAERYLPIAIAAARHDGNEEAAATLSAWDLRADRHSRGAALFYVWLEEARSRVRASLFDGRDGWFPRNAFHAVLDSVRLPWLGAAGPAAFDSIARAALVAAASATRGRAWGDLHRVQSVHALAAAPLLERLLGLDVGPAPGDGASTTVNVSQFDGDFPTRADYGPSQRHVVDMADTDASGGFILPTGQSGIPFDRHYRDQFSRWLNGGLWPIPLDSARARVRALHRLRLTPAIR